MSLKRNLWVGVMLMVVAVSAARAQEEAQGEPLVTESDMAAASLLAQPVEETWWDRTLDRLHWDDAKPYVDDALVFVSGHLQVGLRVVYFDLTEDRKGGKYENSYLGSIYALKDDQHYGPKLFLQWMFNDYVGLGVAYDEVSAITWDGGTDGTVDIDGWIWYAVGAYPNETRFTPFAEVGVGFYDGDFAHDATWRNWRGPASHTMKLEDPRGFSIALGCDVQVFERWDVQLYLRRTKVDVDATYKFFGEPREEGTFPLDNYAWGIGAKYRF
jgi:hypothetical protein